MFDFIYTLIMWLLVLAAVLSGIYATMLTSSKYDGMDHSDIKQFNLYQVWLLIWDHREAYLSTAIFAFALLVMSVLR